VKREGSTYPLLLESKTQPESKSHLQGSLTPKQTLCGGKAGGGVVMVIGAVFPLKNVIQFS